MSDSVKLIPALKVPDDEWNRAALDMGGCFYHTADWRKLLTQAYRGMDDQSVAFFRDDRLVALLPMIRVNKFGFSKVFSMPFSLAGLIGEDSLDTVQKMLVHLRKIADGYKYNCRTPIPAIDRRYLYSQLVVVVDLDRSEDDLKSSLSKSLKRDIKHDAEQVILRPAVSSADISSIQNIYKIRMKHLKTVGTYNDPLLAGILSLPQEWRKITIASLNGETDVAFNISFFRGGISFYFANASMPGYSHYCVNSKLMWDDLMWARKMGSKIHHLGGGLSGTTSDSLYQYKLRWGRPSSDYYYQQSCGLKGLFIDYVQWAANRRFINRAFRAIGV